MVSAFSAKATINSLLLLGVYLTGNPVTCLHRDAYVEVHMINQELVVFNGYLDKAWLNQLHNACIGLCDSNQHTHAWMTQVSKREMQRVG